MKLLARLVVLATLIGVAGFASGCSKSFVGGTEETFMDHASLGRGETSQIRHSIEGFRRGMVEANPAMLAAYSSPKLSFGHSNGVVQSQSEFMEVVRSGAEIFKRVDLTNRKLKIFGDTAVERHHFSADIIYQGKLMNFELEILEIWQKTDRWRLIARQAVKI